MKHTFAFDLDGTVTTKEILPLIARELGIEKKMAELTRRTMDGEIPFDQSFNMRVNMLKKIPISHVQMIVASAPLSSSIVRFMRTHRKNCHIVTGNLDVWIKKLVEKIGVPYMSSTAHFEGDTLLGIRTILRKIEIHNKVKKNVVAIGDGHNDVEMLMNAHIGIAYGGVHKAAPTLHEVAHYSINSERELCRFLKQLS